MNSLITNILMRSSTHFLSSCRSTHFCKLPHQKYVVASGFGAGFHTFHVSAVRNVGDKCKSYRSGKFTRFSRCRDYVGTRSFVIDRTFCKVRNHHNTSNEIHHVNGKEFERVLVQGDGGMSVKPLVVGTVDETENVESSETKGEKVKRDDENVEDRTLEVKREDSDVEKEAWRLLRNAVVKYCGSPVGTVAANDPNDKQPLNYDQVFIRDFVPAALAFLLRGEKEIVKNFLLHTLQLQVILFANVS